MLSAQPGLDQVILASFEGDGSRPLPCKAILHQIVAMYHAKACADSKCDLTGRQRESAPRFLSGQLIRQFGLRSIAVRNVRNLTAGVRKEAPTNLRIRLFGRAVGMLEPSGYHDGLCNVVCGPLRLFLCSA